MADPTVTPTEAAATTPTATPSLVSGSGAQPTAEEAAAATAKAAADAAAATPEAKAAAEKAATEKAAADKVTADKKAEDEKKSGEDAKYKVSKENPFKPEEVKLPEGMEATPEQTTALSEIINEFGIDRRGVDKLIALQAQVTKSASEKASAAWDTLQTEWQATITKDTEFGGEKLAGNMSLIGKLTDKYGDPDLKAQFDLTGAGNNPAIIRFLARIGADMSESQLATGGKPGAGQDGASAAADRIYDKK